MDKLSVSVEKRKRRQKDFGKDGYEFLDYEKLSLAQQELNVKARLSLKKGVL
jgi:hypothetical protein